MDNSEDPVLGADAPASEDSGAPYDDEADDDGAERPRVVSRSVVFASLALLLTLIGGGLATVVSQHSGTRTGGSAEQPISFPNALASTGGTTATASTTNPVPTAAGTATEPHPASSEVPTTGPAAPPAGVQPIEAAAGSGTSHGGAAAPAAPRTSAPPASPRSNVAPAADSAPTKKPTRSAPRCGPVAAFLFLFWTLLGVGPC